jgi:MFS family permease
MCWATVFAASCVVVLLMSAIFFTALLYLPQFVEEVLHYSAIRAGAGLLPMMGLFAATSFIAGGLYGHLGAKAAVSAGAAVLAIGVFLLSLVSSRSGYLFLVPGMCVLGVGVGLFYSSVTTAAVTALDPARSSLAGGIVYMCQIAGGAIGLGINTAIVLSAATLSRASPSRSGWMPRWPCWASPCRSVSSVARSGLRRTGPHPKVITGSASRPGLPPACQQTGRLRGA